MLSANLYDSTKPFSCYTFFEKLAGPRPFFWKMFLICLFKRNVFIEMFNKNLGNSVLSTFTFLKVVNPATSQIINNLSNEESLKDSQPATCIRTKPGQDNTHIIGNIIFCITH